MRAQEIHGDVRAELEWDCVRMHLDRMVERGLKRFETEPAAPGPRELHIELTHRCNLKCVMCEHWEIEHIDPGSVKREMDLEKLRRMVSESETLREVESIAITGGEPWLRADFTDIIAFLTESFPSASIIVLSNFWNTGHIRRTMDEFKARGIARPRLGSSLDGLGKTHDLVRGQEGAFKGLVETARMLRREFPESPFGFTFTITPKNAHELYDAFRFVRGELGCSLGAQWVIDRPGVAPMEWTAETQAEGLRQVRQVINALCREHGAAKLICSPERGRHRALWGELLYWRFLEEYGRDPRRFKFFKRCLAGERHVMLDPEGGVFFCPTNRDRQIGNVGERALDALWHSKEAREQRAFVESCQCHCWLRCMSAPVLDRLVSLAAEG